MDVEEKEGSNTDEDDNKDVDREDNYESGDSDIDLES